MNIDDILAEVGADAIIQQNQDLQDLSRAWVNERSAPEILPWPDSLMERVLERIHKQVELRLSEGNYLAIDSFGSFSP